MVSRVAVNTTFFSPYLVCVTSRSVIFSLPLGAMSCLRLVALPGLFTCYTFLMETTLSIYLPLRQTGSGEPSAK